MLYLYYLSDTYVMVKKNAYNVHHIVCELSVVAQRQHTTTATAVTQQQQAVVVYLLQQGLN